MPPWPSRVDDIREHRMWIPDDVALDSVEAKSAFFKRELAPGKLRQPRHRRGDGAPHPHAGEQHHEGSDQRQPGPFAVQALPGRERARALRWEVREGLAAFATPAGDTTRATPEPQQR